MKQARALVTLAALVLGATTALAQPKPRASAIPAASPAPAASASAAASAAPKASAAPATSGSALPAGHPPVPPAGDGLPPGHPAVDDDDDPPQPGAGHPGAGQGEGPAEDTIVDDPSLPPGTIAVTVKDGSDKPLGHPSIKLDILHSTVAKGDTNDHVTREGDDAGAARFEGLLFGGGHSYRVSTTRGGATYSLGPFGLSAKGGKRIGLHAFEASGKLDNTMLVVMRSVSILSLREDAIQVHQLLSVINMGRTAWIADLPFELPKDFKAFNKQDTGEDARIEEVPGTGAALRGTFPPGQRDLEFMYQVPLEGEPAQMVQIRLPNRISQARVAVEASRTMALEVKGFPPAKPIDNRDGKRYLLTDLAARTPGEASTLDITLTGLPTQGKGRWVAVMLALLALCGGVAYFVQTGNGPLDEDARRDLDEARDALLGEIVALERAHKSGEVGPKTYARVRASLLDALARIVSMIEAADPKKKPAPKRPPRGAEAST